MPNPHKELLAALIDRMDRVKHFAKDGPGWKLAALALEKSPYIVLALGWAWPYFKQ